MDLAWLQGADPGAFLLRLTSDFGGRAAQLARAVNGDAARVEALLERLILSGATDQALRSDGGNTIAYAVYLASKAEHADLAKRLLDGLEGASWRRARRKSGEVG